MLSSVERDLVERFEETLDAIDEEWETIQGGEATELSRLGFESFLYRLRVLIRRLRVADVGSAESTPVSAPIGKERGTFEVDGYRVTWNEYNLQVQVEDSCTPLTLPREAWHRILAKYVTGDPSRKLHKESGT